MFSILHSTKHDRSIMIYYVRRLPRILCNHKYKLIIVTVLILFIFYKLLHWRVICSDLEPWRHVKRLCRYYEERRITGDLCASVCGTVLQSLTCQPFHAGKEVVFTGTRADGSKLVFKTVSQDDHYWLENPAMFLPSEVEFETMIQKHVSNRLNHSITKEKSIRLARFANGVRAEEGSETRRYEIRDVWHLLQDNEYLLATVFEEQDIFPKILGSCGPYFAMEYVTPALEGDAIKKLMEDGKKHHWFLRVHLANMILDLLSELEICVNGGIHLCDIKASHFGISERSGKLKFLDLDEAFPKVIANALVLNNLTCDNDQECHLFDCQSYCNYLTKRCDIPITNNNLQVVCDKIFLGWRMSGRFIVPGLLMSRFTPPQLLSLLRQCAGDTSAHAAYGRHGIQDRLQTTLSEVERLLVAAGYDDENNVVVEL